jgi:surface carbohydrate biosynthesis protein
MKNKYKILCYLDAEKGRDVEILLPLVYFAERFLNCKIKFVLIYDVFAIYRYQPDLVLTSNITGSGFHYRIAKYAHEQNTKVFALFSEGNFPSDNKYNYFGSNLDKKFFQEYVCCWSDRIKDYLTENHPDQKNKIVLTGAPGFDRYKIFPNKKGNVISSDTRQKFDFVIGYAGWGFGRIDNNLRREQLIKFFDNQPEVMDFLEEQREKVFQALKTLIEDNPDVLFILKKHPQETRPCDDPYHERNEMNGLENYENTVYLERNEGIHETMAECDMWMAYDSTSILEYWLMTNNPVIVITPSPLYKRTNNYKGCLNTKSAEEVQIYIDEFRELKERSEYYSKELQENRSEILANAIGFTDGMNHIRVAYYLRDVLNKIDINNNNSNKKFSFKYFMMYSFMKIVSPFYIKKLFSKLPKLKKTTWVFENFRMRNLKKTFELYKLFYAEFYEKNNVESKFNSNNLFNNLLKND